MTDPHTVRFVSGEIEPDGRFIRLRVEPTVGGPIDLRVATVDVSAFSNLLLLLGMHAAVQRPDLKPSEEIIPLSTRSLSVRELVDGNTLLVMEVGAAHLAFVVPSDGIGEIGQTFMTMSASANRHNA